MGGRMSTVVSTVGTRGKSRKESSGMLVVFYLSEWSLGEDSDTTGDYTCRTLRVVNFTVNHFMHFTIWTLSKRALKNYLFVFNGKTLPLVRGFLVSCESNFPGVHVCLCAHTRVYQSLMLKHRENLEQNRLIWLMLNSNLVL